NREGHARYWLENAPDMLDAPGEWYLDPARILTYMPLAGEDPSKVEAIAPAIKQLVRLEGDPGAKKFVGHLRFSGITFSHADWTIGPKGYTDVQAAFDIP